MSEQTQSRVLCIGECMAELAPAERPGQYRLGFAGDSFNTAWYCARLRPGGGVGYFSAAGTDAISQQMIDFISESGINASHVQRVEGRTVGLYLISLDAGERSFSYWRGQSAARALADDAAALERAMAGAGLIYFSGITLAILETPARERLLAALAEARTAGKTVAFDPNLRPGLWASSEEMTGAVMRGAAVSDIVLPSFEDEARWFDDADPVATLHRYEAAGAKTIIVKNGADPVLYKVAGETGAVQVPPLDEVVDTTAAGDSFNAAILIGLQEGAPIADNIARACRLAGQVVRGKGALVPVNMK